MKSLWRPCWLPFLKWRLYFALLTIRHIYCICMCNTCKHIVMIPQRTFVIFLFISYTLFYMPAKLSFFLKHYNPFFALVVPIITNSILALINIGTKFLFVQFYLQFSNFYHARLYLILYHMKDNYVIFIIIYYNYINFHYL